MELQYHSINTLPKMQKKKLYLSVLCMSIFMAFSSTQVGAQDISKTENYYSNPQKGIYPTPPTPYSDANVVSMTDDLSVELESYEPDTTRRRDSLELDEKLSSGLRGAVLAEDAYWQLGNPRYWGWNLYYSWDPWFSPLWNGWYYAGWGGSYWHGGWGLGWGLGWGWTPYWGLGWGWDPWWGTSWAWYWGYPYYYAWGSYAWGGPHGAGMHGGPTGGNGHSYIGGGGRGKASRSAVRPTGRGTSASALSNRGARRGGVDVGRSSSRLERPAASRTRTTNQTVRNSAGSQSRTALQNRTGYGNTGRSLENGYRTTFDRQVNGSDNNSNRNTFNNRSRSNDSQRSTTNTSRSIRSIGSSSRSTGGSLGGSRGGSIGGSRGGSFGGSSRGSMRR